MNKVRAADAQSFMFATTASFAEESLTFNRQADVLSRDLSLGLGAAGTILAVAREDGFVVVSAHGAIGIDTNMLAMLGDCGDVSCRWRQFTNNGRQIDFFVAVLQPAESEEILVFSLFDQPIAAAAKAEIERKFLLRRPLATSYLEILKLNGSRRHRESALEKALSTLQTGVVLLDEHANVVFSNVVADSIFKAADCLKLHRGRLLATNLRDNVRLTVALQHVAALDDAGEDHRRVPMLALARSDQSRLILLALPLCPLDGMPGDAVTILHIVDPTVDFAKHVRPVCRIYQLSRAETDLACLLAKGLTLSHAAEILRLKEQTARSSLRSIFYKTGTGRQTELVLLLLSHVVPTNSTLTIDAF